MDEMVDAVLKEYPDPERNEDDAPPPAPRLYPITPELEARLQRFEAAVARAQEDFRVACDLALATLGDPGTGKAEIIEHEGRPHFRVIG
jgi:hypothetical protein